MGLSTSAAPIFFTHVPKCAGTSIHTLLDTKYPSDKFFRTIRGATRESFLSTPSRFLADYDYLGGHLYDFDCSYKVGQAVRITTLREPASRLQSMMNHVLRSEKGDGLEVFSAFRSGDPKGFYDFLQREYYVRSSVLSYFSDEAFLTGFNPQSYSPDLIEKHAQRVASSYCAIINQNEIDEFLGWYGRPSRYSISSRRMVGSDLGEYTNFKEKFDDEVYCLLEPDIRFHERLLELRAPLKREAMSKTRKSWVLNWDEPVDCYGFTLRALGKSRTSTVPEFTSRPTQQTSVSIFVPLESSAPCRFSGLLWLPDPEDITQLAIQLNGEPVAYRYTKLDPKLIFFYGELDGHPGDAEWLFDFTDGMRSRTVWFNDFCVHAFET